MNTVFRVVFNAATRTFTAASEAAKTKRVAATVLSGVIALGAGTAVASSTDADGNKWNDANDIFVSTTDESSSSLHAVADKVITIDDSLKDIAKRQNTQDGRDNELSDREYRTDLSEKNGIHYEGDKVIRTDEPMRDKETGAIMHDREGKVIMKAAYQKGSDSVAFRGDNGTTLKNVANGEVSSTSKEAVNGSQLKEVSDVADSAIHYDKTNTTTSNPLATETDNGPVITLKEGNEGEHTGTTIRNVRGGEVSSTSTEAVNGSQLNEQVGRINGVSNTANQNTESIKVLNDTKADKTETAEIRKAAEREQFNRVAADEKAQTDIKNLNSNKADKTETVEIRDAAAKESEERIKNDAATNQRIDTTNSNLDNEAKARAAADANQQKQIDTKADAREVNEWLETKVDNDTFKADQDAQNAEIAKKANQSDLDKTNANVAGNATAIANESNRAQQAETANANAAKAAQQGADAANAGVATNGTAITKERSEREADSARLDAQKVDKTDFQADQRRQDAALESETKARTADVNDSRQKAATAQKSADTANAGVTTLSNTKADRSELNAEAKARQNGDAALEAKKADRSEVKAVEANANRANDRVDGVQAHQKVQDSAINKAQSTADAGLTVGNAAYKQSQANAEDIQTLNSEVNRVDARSAQRAQKAEQNANAYTDSKVAGLKQDINGVRQEERAGIAAAVAGSNIPQAIHAGRGNIGAGFGNFKGTSAVAVGGSYRMSDDQTTIKATVGVGSGSNITFGAGASYEF